MFKQIMLSTVVAGLSLQIMAANTIIDMQTNQGVISIELFNDQAPISTKNFENYVKTNFYNNTVFHRVIPDFMIQGGGMDINMIEKPTNAPIINESTNGLKNTRGTLAMARTNDPNSASSQFFINVVDNNFLNKSSMNAGYAVFGKVIKGMDIVDRMSKTPTKNYGMHQNVPVTPLIIQSMTIKEAMH